MPVFVPDAGDAPPREASSEYRVHRAVYRETPHSAIVHAHPVHAVAASLDADLVRPADSEGGMLCPEIPVVTGNPGTDEIAENVAGGALRDGHIVIVRGARDVCSRKNARRGVYLHLDRRVRLPNPLLIGGEASGSSVTARSGGLSRGETRAACR